MSRSGFHRLCFTFLAAALFLPTSGALSPPPEDCNCNGLNDCITWGCPDVLSSICTVTLIDGGLCNEEPNCDENTPEPCIWLVHLQLVMDDTGTEVQLFFNGMVIVWGKGQLTFGPRVVSQDCGNQLTIALGTDDSPCVEAFMECEPCDPN